MTASSCRTRRRRLVYAALAWCLLAGCQGRPGRVIAVVPKSNSHMFWQTVRAGAKAAGREFGVEIVWNGAASETDYSRQIQIVDSMIARRVDGLAVAASDRTALNNSLARAAAAGIPVAVFDSGVDSEDYTTFVATDNYEAGKLAARKLAELIGEKGKIAIVLHAPGSYSSMERERGFDDAIAAEFPGITVVARQFGMSDRARAMAVTENIVTAHPDLAGLFASAEPSSVGAALAVRSRGLTGKLRIVAFDAAEATIEDLKAGTVDALVAQDPFRIGYQAVRALVERLNGNTPPRRIDLGARAVTRADLSVPEVRALLFPDLKQYLE